MTIQKIRNHIFVKIFEIFNYITYYFFPRKIKKPDAIFDNETMKSHNFRISNVLMVYF